jgi:hypothetical protein
MSPAHAAGQKLVIVVVAIASVVVSGLFGVPADTGRSPSGTLLLAQNEEVPSGGGKQATSPGHDDVEPTAGRNEQNAPQVKLNDVKAGQRIRVVLENGSTFIGKPDKVTEDHLELKIPAGTINFSRAEIQRVELLNRPPGTQAETGHKRPVEEGQVNRSQSELNGDGREVQERSRLTEPSGNRTGSATKNNDRTNEDKQKLVPTDKKFMEKFPAETWNKKRYAELLSREASDLNDRERIFLKNWERLRDLRKRRNELMLKRLIELFPPDDGWGKERYKTIKNEKSLFGQGEKPARTRKERQFLDIYEQWQKAYKRVKRRTKTSTSGSAPSRPDQNSSGQSARGE